MTQSTPAAAPRTSVVVPTHNAGRHLLALLRSLAVNVGEHATEPATVEVVLSDDGSDDGSVDACAAQKWPFRLRLVRHPAPSGAGAARNRGWRAAASDLIVFVDADDEVAPGFLEAITEPIAAQRADLVAARRDFESLNQELDVSAAALRGSSPVPVELQPGSGVVVSGGSGMAVRRDLLERLHGFDERLRRREDQDFWLRAQYLGATTDFTPGAVVKVRRRAEVEERLEQVRVGGEWTEVFFALHPELTDARGRWNASTRWPWLLPRLPYAILPGRRTILAGGFARRAGRLAGRRRVRAMERAGQLCWWHERNAR